MLRRNVTLPAGLSGAWLMVFTPGLALIGFGVLILLVPQLLVVLVAGLSMFVGLGLTSFGWRMRHATKIRTSWQEPPAGPFVS